MWNKFIQWLRKIDAKIEEIHNPSQPKYRMETRFDNGEKQIATIDVYKDEIFSHLVNIFYLTKEQADDLAKLQDELHNESRRTSANTK